MHSTVQRTKTALGVTKMRKSIAILMFLAACGSKTGPAVEPTSEATAEPTAAPTVVATAEPTAAPTAEPVVETPTAPTTRPPSGRPALGFSDPVKVTQTVGASPIANFTLSSENAKFRVPEWALDEGVLLTFMIDKKPAKKAKGGAGSVFRLQAQIPPAESFSMVTSNGPKFELRLPTVKVASPNLAVGVAKKDDKGRDTIEWKVIAPSKVEGDIALFELSEFSDLMLQITSEAPSP